MRHPEEARIEARKMLRAKKLMTRSSTILALEPMQPVTSSLMFSKATAAIEASSYSKSHLNSIYSP